MTGGRGAGLKALAVAAVLTLSGCGVVYISPDVQEGVTDAGLNVRVVPMTADTTAAANDSSFEPRSLPPELSRTLAVSSRPTGAGALPAPIFERPAARQAVVTNLPGQVPERPYRIGVGDVLLFASPSPGNTVEQLTGLLAAQNARQGYTVQDDGSIAIPGVGRVPVADMTLEDAEAALFERLVEAGIEPTFSLEIAEFGARRVAVGGAVVRPGILPIGLTALELGEAILLAGGIPDEARAEAVIRLFRDGRLYEVPAAAFYSDAEAQALRLVDGDRVFVDTAFDLAAAERWFEEQIRLSGLRRSVRADALAELETEIAIRRAALQDGRERAQSELDLGAMARDYVYLAGEVSRPARVPLPFEQRATLADVLYSEGGFSNSDANPSQIYVLRGSDDPGAMSDITAYNLDTRNAANLLLATRFEMRPNDIVFIAEQPVTRWNRAVSLIIPNIVTAAATN